MSITVHVQWESGQPCSGVQVAVRLVGGACAGGTVTDRTGTVNLPLPPATGILACDGQDVYAGALAQHIEVIIQESRLFTYNVALPSESAP